MANCLLAGDLVSDDYSEIVSSINTTYVDPNNSTDSSRPVSTSISRTALRNILWASEQRTKDILYSNDGLLLNAEAFCINTLKLGRQFVRARVKLSHSQVSKHFQWLWRYYFSLLYAAPYTQWSKWATVQTWSGKELNVQLREAVIGTLVERGLCGRYITASSQKNSSDMGGNTRFGTTATVISPGQMCVGPASNEEITNEMLQKANAIVGSAVHLSPSFSWYLVFLDLCLTMLWRSRARTVSPNA